MSPHLTAVQAIGAEGVVAAQCRALVKSYLPQLIKIIATMPSDQVRSAVSCCAGCAVQRKEEKLID